MERGRAGRRELIDPQARQLQQNRDRLVYLTQLASWQVLARKMAHEVKNSLTPIRLTVEEMRGPAQRGRSQALFWNRRRRSWSTKWTAWRRRVRAFSEFAAEPPVRPGPMLDSTPARGADRVFGTAHPEVIYNVRLGRRDSERVRRRRSGQGRADESSGERRRSRRARRTDSGSDAGFRCEGVAIEVHDSGPGLSEQARRSLFQPTISFKKRGMGLGLSIARRSALLFGGDISAHQRRTGRGRFSGDSAGCNA